jgi:hypothetical protein
LDDGAGKRPGQRDETDCERARGQEEEILAMLRDAASCGCTNTQLWEIAHAVNSRISDLRKRGYRIKASPEGGGVWRYRLIETAPPPLDPPHAGKSPTEPKTTLPLFTEARQ